MSRDILDYGDICDACGRKQLPDDSRVFLHVPTVNGRFMVLCSGCRQDSRQWPTQPVDKLSFTFADAIALGCVFAVSAGLAAAVVIAAIGGRL